MYHLYNLLKMGIQPFFKVRKSQIRKFFRWASPQIFMINTQIENSQISTKILHNSVLKHFVKIWNRALYAKFVGRKSKYLRTYGNVNSAYRKKGPHIAIPQSATFAEGPQTWQIISIRKFADLRFAELICGPPTFAEFSYCVQGTFLKCSGWPPPGQGDCPSAACVIILRDCVTRWIIDLKVLKI